MTEISAKETVIKVNGNTINATSISTYHPKEISYIGGFIDTGVVIIEHYGLFAMQGESVLIEVLTPTESIKQFKGVVISVSTLSICTNLNSTKVELLK